MRETAEKIAKELRGGVTKSGGIDCLSPTLLLDAAKEIEMLARFADFVNLWCHRESKNLTAEERLDVIKHHPTAKAYLVPSIHSHPPIAFERAVDLAASQLAFFEDETRPEPTENQRLMAGHIVGNLWANGLLNDKGEDWVRVESEDNFKRQPA